MTQNRSFTLGFKDAMMHGIDYRDFEKVRTLPEDVELTAVAGVWGDYADLRCLFICKDGTQVCRTVWSRSKYLIPELQRYGKEINVGERFVVSKTLETELHKIATKLR